MKKNLLIIFMYLVGLFNAVNAQNVVTVGVYDEEIDYSPINTYYDYTISMQIYTADELFLDSCRINQIAFYQTSENDYLRNIEVYMLNTEYSSFEGYADWLNIQESDKVFDDTIQLEEGWVKIPFDAPFTYSGDNILLCVVDKTGDYLEHSYFAAYDVDEDQAMTDYRDGTPYASMNLDNFDIIDGTKNYIQIFYEPLIMPAVPVLTAEALLDSTIIIEWNKDKNAEYYNLYEGAELLASLEETEFVVEDLELGEEYCFTVTAVNSIGETEPSNQACATVMEILPPKAPVVEAYATSDTEITLEWDEVRNAQYYIVYKGSEELETVTETMFLDEGLTSLTDYCYTVVAGNDSGESEYSEWACATTEAAFDTIVADIEDEDDLDTGMWPLITDEYYACTQQIYTAEELGLDECEITKIGFYQTSENFYTRELEIYMVNTDKESFDSEEDFVNMKESDKVFEGKYTIDTAWFEIPLDNTFVYEGKNILLCVIDHTGHDYSSTDVLIYSADTTTALVKVAWAYPFDPSDLNGNVGVLLYAKNVIKLYYDEVRVCAAPVVTAEALIDETIILEWDKVKGAKSYEVYQGTEKIAEIDATEYIVDGLEIGEEYCFTVVAVNDAGESEHSDEACATVMDLLPLEAPVVEAEVAGTEITLTWDAVRNAEKYLVYYESVQLAEVTETTFTLGGFESLTEYCFYVVAVNRFDNEPSEWVCVTTETGNVKIVAENNFKVPGLPIKTYYNYSISQQIYTAEQLGLEENGEISAISFYQYTNNKYTRDIEIYMLNTDKESFEDEIDWVNVTDDDLVFQGEYTLNKAWCKFDLDNSFTYTGGNVLLCVVDNTGYYEEESYFAVDSTEAYQAIWFYTDDFEIDVDTLIEYERGDYLEPCVNHIKLYYELAFEAALEAPELEAEATSHTEIALTWNEVEGAENYDVYYYNLKIATTETTEYVVEDLEPLTEYCFSVVAVNEDGASEHSDEVCAETLDLPITAPVVTAEATSDTTIVLTWGTIANAEFYCVYQGEDSIAGVTDTVYTVVGLEADTEYCFTVMAVRGSQMELSEEVCAKTLDLPITAPVVTAEATSDTTIVLTWGTIANAEFYCVYQGEDSIAGVTDTVYTVVGLEADTEYCFTVMAVRGSQMELSEEVCAKTLAVTQPEEPGDGVEETVYVFNIYPNPASDRVVIETEATIEEVTIYTITGVMVYSEVDFNDNTINVSDFANGVYVMKVRTDNGESFQRFIKK